MKKMLIKRYLVFVATVLVLFSCTTKEEKVKEYVEQNVVTQAEEYLICQAIIKYVQTDVEETFTNRINYYVNNPYYDLTYAERYLGNDFIAIAQGTGMIKEKFDKRWNEYGKLNNMLSYEGNIEYWMHLIDSNLTFKALIKDVSAYSIDDIADIYFKPNHMKFTEITPKLFDNIFRSILCLGAATYKYDVVDEIRVTEKEENEWNVDLVYHSGYCLTLEAKYNEENGFFISDAPWISNATGWGEEEVSGSEAEL